MAVLYKLYKMVRTFKDGRDDKKANNHWFARAVVVDETSTDKLASIIEEKCTLTHADIVACIKALVTAIRDEMQDSKRVVLDGLGSFKIGLKTSGSESAAEFSVTKNITGAHVIFQPACHIDAGTGKRTLPLLEGVKVKETPLNLVTKD